MLIVLGTTYAQLSFTQRAYWSRPNFRIIKCRFWGDEMTTFQNMVTVNVNFFVIFFINLNLQSSSNELSKFINQIQFDFMKFKYLWPLHKKYSHFVASKSALNFPKICRTLRRIHIKREFSLIFGTPRLCFGSV